MFSHAVFVRRADWGDPCVMSYYETSERYSTLPVTHDANQQDCICYCKVADDSLHFTLDFYVEIYA